MLIFMILFSWCGTLWGLTPQEKAALSRSPWHHSMLGLPVDQVIAAAQSGSKKTKSVSTQSRTSVSPKSDAPASPVSPQK